MKIDRLDHLVLTVADIEATCDFYTRVLGMEQVVFGNGRVALHFGQQKINLHQAKHEFEPRAKNPTPGSADLCLITSSSISEVLAILQSYQIDIIEGPIPRTGAVGPISSIYLRDPDQNLIEISSYK